MLCEKVLRTSEGQCTLLDVSFRGKRKCVGGATLFCDERQVAMREAIVDVVLLHRPCRVLSLLSLLSLVLLSHQQRILEVVGGEKKRKVPTLALAYLGFHYPLPSSSSSSSSSSSW